MSWPAGFAAHPGIASHGDAGSWPEVWNTGPVASNKPRILQNQRDMLLTMIPLVLLIALVAGISGLWSNPDPAPVGSIDETLALEYDATIVDFPIRIPDAPSEWQPNSGQRVELEEDGGGIVTWIGYVTDDNLYLRYSQSGISAQRLVEYHYGDINNVLGTETVDGTTWTLYRAGNGEPIWLVDLDDVRIAMTGSATEAQFTTMAERIMAVEPLD